MKKEKSCGAVIYKYIDNKLNILLLLHNMGHYSFCKGHVEGNENEIETATREIKEETNLSVLIDSNFREVITYSPFPDILKDVVYFVASPTSDNIKVQEDEIQNIEWYTVDMARELITYKEDKNILEKAIKYINGKNN